MSAFAKSCVDREERDRKAYQNLANDIFGKAKKERTQQNEHRKLGAGPSLASRVGITKVRLERPPKMAVQTDSCYRRRKGRCPIHLSLEGTRTHPWRRKSRTERRKSRE